MTTSLKNTIHELASSFAASVLGALRGMSLEEILAATSGGGGGGRRSGNTPARAEAAPAAAKAPGGGGRSRGRGRGRGRLSRRSATDIQGLIDQIVGLLEKNPGGLRAEQIREQLGLESKELPRPIAEALSSKRISKQGQKRATTYFPGGGRGGGGGGAAKRAGGGGGKRAAKRGGGGGKRGGRGRAKASASQQSSGESGSQS